MKKLTMVNGEVVNAGDADQIPWCPDCEAWSVPVDGECGVCETAITWVPKDPDGR